MGLKIFISHASKDYELAKTLKNILEEHDSIKEAFVYEDKKKLGTQISEKITSEIDSSDYFVALITNNSIESASVNQEYGYAQAKNLHKIPFLEKGSEEGIMIYGSEQIVFSQDNFAQKCVEVKQYIIENGIPEKITAEEKNLIQKSAFYRQYLEWIIEEFLDGLYYRFDIGQTNRPSVLASDNPESQRFINEIKNFFAKDVKENVLYLSKIDFYMFKKLDWELRHAKQDIEQTKRFPHSEMFQEEVDLLVTLNESLSAMNDGDLDFGKYCEDSYHPDKPFDFQNCDQVMKEKQYASSIRRYIQWNYLELAKIVNTMICLLELYSGYRQKFGKIAFKSTIDESL